METEKSPGEQEKGLQQAFKKIQVIANKRSPLVCDAVPMHIKGELTLDTRAAKGVSAASY
jgi:hypothetical protein